MAANEQSGVDALGAETIYVDVAEGRRIHIGKSARARLGWALADKPVQIIIQAKGDGAALIRPSDLVKARIDKLVDERGEEAKKALALVLHETTIQTNGNIFLPTPVVKGLQIAGERLAELIVRAGPIDIEIMNARAFAEERAKALDLLKSLDF